MAKSGIALASKPIQLIVRIHQAAAQDRKFVRNLQLNDLHSGLTPKSMVPTTLQNSLSLTFLRLSRTK